LNEARKIFLPKIEYSRRIFAFASLAGSAESAESVPTQVGAWS
jgi:hypothetical protein